LRLMSESSSWQRALVRVRVRVRVRVS
jgi:hypothetical protein